MKATSYLACLCVILGWGIGGAEGRGPHLFLLSGLSMCSPALSHPRLLSLEPRAVCHCLQRQQLTIKIRDHPILEVFRNVPWLWQH